jgi:hypothetical protein
MRYAVGAVLCAGVMAAVGTARPARAQERGAAIVGVGWAEPPPPPRREPPILATDEYGSHDEYPQPEPYRSVMRLHLGPVGATTGRGVGLGLGLAADFGRGSVGVRLAAAWARGEPAGPATSPIGDGLAQYTGELTIDLNKRGPLHPVMGFGLGVARVARGDASGNIGVGTARLGVEYALALEDADVRFGAGLTGVLPGPAEREVQDVKGWALLGASVGVGF